MTEKEELQMLRELVKKQKLQLSEKDEVIRRQQIQIENMTQALLHARKKMFGRSSEVSTGYEQLCLFEENTELAKALLKEQEAIVVKEHKKTPRKPGVRKEMLADLPKEIEEYIINPEEKCSVCGGELKVIGKEIVRTEVEFQPATLIVKQIVRQIAKCTVCGSDGNDRPAHMQKASVPAKVLPHSIATHSLVAQIMYQKFEMGAPFARLEKDFYRMGLDISRANMHLEDVKNNFCWSHLRRYYIDSIPLDSSGKEIPGSKGAEGREYINLLFNLESEMSDLPYNERKVKRQEASRALLDAFWSWVENTISIPTTNEKLTKALNYSLNHKKEFEMFLEDGRLEISNNLCESHIRPFATARRAWLFADTPNGAKANAVLYTLVETARANDLNVYAYLDYLLAEMPNADFYNHPEIIDDMLPWSDKLPESCRITHKHKKSSKK